MGVARYRLIDGRLGCRGLQQGNRFRIRPAFQARLHFPSRRSLCHSDRSSRVTDPVPQSLHNQAARFRENKSGRYHFPPSGSRTGNLSRPINWPLSPSDPLEFFDGRSSYFSFTCTSLSRYDISIPPGFKERGSEGGVDIPCCPSFVWFILGHNQHNCRRRHHVYAVVQGMR